MYGTVEQRAVGCKPAGKIVNRKAFTLIEVLVAIGIIVILAGAALYAMRGAGNTAKTQATHVTLDNLKSMLAEYELQTRLGVAPPGWWKSDAPNVWAPPGCDFWHNVSPNANQPTAAPLLVTNGEPDRTMSLPVQNTVMAMRAIATIPANRAAIGKLPPNRLLSINFTGGDGNPYTAQLLLDDWGNPIVFVPASGLGRTIAMGLPFSPVYVGGNATTGTPNTIQAPSNRPFFASAGPDGNFATGDDNIYSFEQ